MHLKHSVSNAILGMSCVLEPQWQDTASYTEILHTLTELTSACRLGETSAAPGPQCLR